MACGSAIARLYDATQPLARKYSRIVFLGNCQFAKLSKLYDTHFAVGDPETVTWINPQAGLPQLDRQKLGSAEIVVWQISGQGTKTELSKLAPGAKIIPVPLVSASFLWPFGGRPHPRNCRLPHAPNGPYDPELGDAFLNKLIAAGVSEEEALVRYRDLDFAKHTDLDRLYELWSAEQHRRDEVTGFQTAPLIEHLLREEHIFLTPHHPNLSIFRHLARQVFERLDCGTRDIERVLSTLWASPFAPDALPVHPAVAKHFGLKWATDDYRFSLRHEGAFTFAEYVRRYVRFEWNESLAQGIHLAASPHPSSARRLLSEAVKHSPTSAAGYVWLSRVLQREKAGALALDAARKAAALDPADPNVHSTLGSSLLLVGNEIEAEVAFRKALTVHPPFAPAFVGLGRMLMSLGRVQEAQEIVEHGLGFHPYNGLLLILLSNILIRLEEWDAAEITTRRAIEVQPKNAELYWKLAEILGKKAEREIAAIYRASIPLRPDHPHPYAQLGLLATRSGMHQNAENAFRAALDRQPANADYKAQLVEAIIRQGRLEDALTLVEGFLQLGVSDPRLEKFLNNLSNQRRNSAVQGGADCPSVSSNNTATGKHAPLCELR